MWGPLLQLGLLKARGADRGGRGCSDGSDWRSERPPPPPRPPSSRCRAVCPRNQFGLFRLPLWKFISLLGFRRKFCRRRGGYPAPRRKWPPRARQRTSRKEGTSLPRRVALIPASHHGRPRRRLLAQISYPSRFLLGSVLVRRQAPQLLSRLSRTRLEDWLGALRPSNPG